MSYIRLPGLFRRNRLLTVSLIAGAVRGFLVCLLGELQPWIFFLALLPSTFGLGLTRPPSTNLMLEQQKENTGAASSLMNCTFNLAGCIGIVIISLDWTNRIMVLGLLYLIAAVLCLVFWFFISKKPFIRQ